MQRDFDNILIALPLIIGSAIVTSIIFVVCYIISNMINDIVDKIY